MLVIDVSVRVNDDGSIGNGIIGDGSIFVDDSSTRIDYGRESFGRQSSDSDGRIRGGGWHVAAFTSSIGGGVWVPPIRLALLVKIGRV